MTKTIWLGLSACLVCGGFWWIIGQNKPEAIVEPVVMGDAVNAIAGNLEVKSVLETVVKSERYGVVRRVAALPIDQAVSIEVGEMIAELDTIELDSQIELLNLQLASARDREKSPSEFELQVDRLNREQSELAALGEAGRVSSAQIENIEAEVERLTLLASQEKQRRTQEVVLLESQLAQRQFEKQQMTIVAPSAGTLNATYVFQGDIVNPGSSVARIFSHQNFIEVSVREEDFAGLAIGNLVEGRFQAYPGETFTGSVTGLSPLANAVNRQRSVFVELDLNDRDLVPGMTGQAVLIKDVRSSVTVVPRRAWIGGHVYVVDQGKVEIREVETGFVGMEQVEILSGVEAGEWVIVDRPHRFRDGESISIKKL